MDTAHRSTSLYAPAQTTPTTPLPLRLGVKGRDQGVPEPPVDPEGGVPLSTLATGDRAIVLAVDSSTTAGRRLLDLGFVPGTEVRVVRRSPLRDPTAFYLRGSQLCLRRSEAARIRVVGVRPAGGG
jgi:ferrous iron transport protein A